MQDILAGYRDVTETGLTLAAHRETLERESHLGVSASANSPLHDRLHADAGLIAGTERALTPLYVKTLVQAAWTISWRARKSVMTRW